MSFLSRFRRQRPANDSAKSAGHQWLVDISDRVARTRSCLYKALGKDGNPSFGAVLKVIRAMGLELHISPQR
jgi:DNA-binding phage protein